MESILVIDSINVKKYGKDNVADIEIDDGRLSVSISTTLSLYEKRYFKTKEKKLAREMGKKCSVEKICHVLRL